MSEYQITCCSTADMPAQYFEEKKIPFVCFNFLMDGVQYPDDLGKSMPFKEFYKKIADGAEPTTAQVNTQQYMELFEPILQKGLDILHLTLSSGISGFIRGGRISKVSGFVGQALNICPLMNVNSEGKLIPRSKYRGKKQVIREMVKRMEEHAKGGTAYSGKCFISCSACEEDARKVADMIEEKFPNLDGKVLINSIGTVIGAHTGPGTVALFFWGDERTI